MAYCLNLPNPSEFLQKLNSKSLMQITFLITDSFGESKYLTLYLSHLIDIISAVVTINPYKTADSMCIAKSRGGSWLPVGNQPLVGLLTTDDWLELVVRPGLFTEIHDIKYYLHVFHIKFR